MKILILNWRDIKDPKSGGAEIATFEHARYWTRAGHSVTWFTASYPHCISSEVVNGVKFIRKGNSHTVYFYAAMYYLFNNSFDLVIDEVHGLPFCTPLYVKKSKILAYAHEVADEIWDYMYGFPLNIIGKYFERILYRLYLNVHVMTVSESTKNDLIKIGISGKMIHVIRNGLRANSKVAKCKKGHIPIFLFMSRIVKMKGIEEVIKSFALINKALKNAQLLIAGSGELRYITELKNMIKSYGIYSKVKFYFHPSEKMKFLIMKKAHLLLHASIREGWGLVVIEAASQATPSIVYNVSGLRDSVKNNITGVVLNENTPRAMAENALDLLKDNSRYLRFQLNCLQWAKENSWESSARDSLNLIESL